jgi:hypothetical protein
MPSTQDTNVRLLIKRTHTTEDVKSKRVSVALKEATYLQLLSMGKMKQTFDSVISKLIAEHGDKKGKETSSQPASGLRPLEQVATTKGADCNSLVS